MDIAELTRIMHEMVSAKGWYEADSKRPQSPRNIATSLVLEASEVLEHFQWGETSPNPAELAGELADVALYLIQLASLCDIDLEQAILGKVAVNYTRTWDQTE